MKKALGIKKIDFVKESGIVCVITYPGDKP